jgi:ferredoxin-NADP reductase
MSTTGQPTVAVSGREADTDRSDTDLSGTDWITAVVDNVELVADEVVVLTLRPTGAGELPEWAPGAHIDVHLGPGRIRQYSLCGEPEDRSRWRIAVLREPRGRGGSARAHELRVGDSVPVRGPRNHFALDPAPGYLFVAGGIGITPILPMVRQAERSGVPWRLFYGGRRRGSMAFTDELGRHGDKVVVWPEDEQGLLDLDKILADAPEGTLVYCCGPEGLLTAVTGHGAPWPGGKVRIEHFSPVAVAGPVRDLAFQVECRASRVTVTVGPDESILEAVERAGGVVVASSCREGICGTCETTVLDGVPEHRDSVLTEEERAAGEVIMTCVSRARGDRLVLDL